VCLIEVEQAIRARTNEAERVVNHAWTVSFDCNAVETDRTTPRMAQLDEVRAVRHLHRIHCVADFIGSRRDGDRLLTVEAN